MQRPFLGFWPERKRMEKRRVEILAPAGSYESMVAAVNAGANAVYIGGSRFGARAYADNLDEEAMIRAIDFVHLHNCRIYMTVNTLVKEKELPEKMERKKGPDSRHVWTDRKRLRNLPYPFLIWTSSGRLWPWCGKNGRPGQKRPLGSTWQARNLIRASGRSWRTAAIRLEAPVI